MDRYIDYLNDIYDKKTAARKLEYLKYNFSGFVKPGAKVLEIGPGLGEFLQFALDCGAKSLDVIDRDKSILDNLKTKFPLDNCWQAELEHVSNNSQMLGCYDLIFMLQILEHVRTDALIDILQALYSHLNPGGVILITVPNGGNPLGVVERYADMTHHTLFSETSLRQLTRLAQLSDCEVSVQGYRIPPSGGLNIARIFVQKVLHMFLKGMVVANGGSYSNLYEPNITLVLKRLR